MRRPLAGTPLKAHLTPLMADTDLLTRTTTPEPRMLPSNLEAEAAFLGAVLIDRMPWMRR